MTHCPCCHQTIPELTDRDRALLDPSDRRFCKITLCQEANKAFRQNIFEWTAKPAPGNHAWGMVPYIPHVCIKPSNIELELTNNVVAALQKIIRDNGVQSK